jgi:hypothetical protein
MPSLNACNVEKMTNKVDFPINLPSQSLKQKANKGFLRYNIVLLTQNADKPQKQNTAEM